MTAAVCNGHKMQFVEPQTEDERQILEEFAHALEQGIPNVDRLVE
jgi:hypothetical protein